MRGPHNRWVLVVGLLACLIPVYGRHPAPPYRLWRLRLLGGCWPVRERVREDQLRPGDIVLLNDAPPLYCVEGWMPDSGLQLRRLEAGRPGR